MVSDGVFASSFRYYHELFLRGRSDLCQRMVRTRVKGNGMKAASSPSTEPNFYAMEPCFDACKSSIISDDSSREGEDRMWKMDSDPIPSSIMKKPFPSLDSVGPRAVVSLPSTPQQEPRKLSALEWPSGLSVANPLSKETAGPGLIPMCDEFDAFPQNGDEVFFEGLKFRYLDRVEFNDLESEIAYLQESNQTASV